MSKQETYKTCPKCKRNLKPGVISPREIGLVCRYCNYIDGKGIQIKINKAQPIPKKCPICESQKIILISNTEDEDNLWRCENEKCLVEFKWKKFIVIFAVNVRVECCPEDVENIAHELIDNGESELMGYWEEGKKKAHLHLKIEDK